MRLRAALHRASPAARSEPSSAALAHSLAATHPAYMHAKLKHAIQGLGLGLHLGFFVTLNPKPILPDKGHNKSSCQVHVRPFPPVHARSEYCLGLQTRVPEEVNLKLQQPR